MVMKLYGESESERLGLGFYILVTRRQLERNDTRLARRECECVCVHTLIVLLRYVMWD